MGRCICQCHSIHGYVADGKKKSGKLVLVDCNQYGVNTFILREALRVYKRILFDFIDNGFFWLGRMDKTCAQKSSGKWLRRSSSSDLKAQVKALYPNNLL